MDNLPATGSNLPVTTPAEGLSISPEALEVANCYLQLQDVNAVVAELDVPLELVTQILEKREVRAYIDMVFGNLGFNNRFKMASAMDAIIAKKFKDMDEADVGSTKDISELLALKHKMAMEYMDRELKLAAIHASTVKTQTNIQINEGVGTKYSALIEKLLIDSTP